MSSFFQFDRGKSGKRIQTIFVQDKGSGVVLEFILNFKVARTSKNDAHATRMDHGRRVMTKFWRRPDVVFWRREDVEKWRISD